MHHQRPDVDGAQLSRGGVGAGDLRANVVSWTQWKNALEAAELGPHHSMSLPYEDL